MEEIIEIIEMYVIINDHKKHCNLKEYKLEYEKHNVKIKDITLPYVGDKIEKTTLKKLLGEIETDIDKMDENTLSYFPIYILNNKIHYVDKADHIINMNPYIHAFRNENRIKKLGRIVQELSDRLYYMPPGYVGPGYLECEKSFNELRTKETE